MARDGEHFFMCFLAFWTFSFEKFLFRAGRVAQAVERLPSKYEVQTPVPPKKKLKKKKENLCSVYLPISSLGH
jgi:hypothetical protein